VGASILLFSITPDQYIYFLLGQEAEHKGYKESGKWSDFGGGATLYEDEYTCAAREFLEETQRTINPFPAKYGHSIPDMFMITEELRNRNFTARIDFNFLNTHRPRTYTTFLIQIPWDPTLRSRFAKRVRASQVAQTFPTVNRYTNFQGKFKSTRRGLLEKSAIQFFSIPTLMGVRKGNTTRVPPEPRVELRAFFQRRMSKILALAFPKNVARYQTLDTKEACRALYQGAGVRIPLPPQNHDTPAQKWTRGAQLPTQSNTASDQPPSRIFQNFNTHRKYPSAALRDPVDKIFY